MSSFYSAHLYGGALQHSQPICFTLPYYTPLKGECCRATLTVAYSA